MDKVIIDGIDISGCPFYQYQTKEDYEMRYPESGDCEIGLAGYLFDYSRITEELEKACIDNPNCYYKQLKRKEQECEELNKELDDYVEKANKYFIKYERYKQALEDIKDIADRTDGNHPANVINMVSVIRHTINSVIGAEE